VSEEEFHIASGKEQIALLAPRDRGFVLRFLESWQGWVCVDGHTYALRDLAAIGWAKSLDEGEVKEFVIPGDCTIVVQFDLLEFWIRPTEVATRLPRRPPAGMGDPIFKYCFATALLVLGLIFAADNLPEVPKTLSAKRFDPSPLLLQSRDLVIDSSPKPAARPSIGKPRSRTKSALTKAEPFVEVSEEPAPDSVEGARARARKAGIAGLSPGVVYAEVAATVDFPYSDEEAERLKGVLPSEVDGLTGAWGHGVVKIGPGSGDGKDWGTVKSKGYGAVKRGSIGNAYAAKALSRPHEVSGPIATKAVASILESGIAYDVIHGHMGMRKRRFSRCFEENVSEDEDWPSLVHVRFEIAPSGQVQEAELEELEGHSAQACVEDTIRSIQFPEPSDGKVVRVEHFPVRV
jgi:hypothetical protein